MAAKPDFRFYLITDRQQCHPRSLTQLIAAACQAGVKAVQIREKGLSAAQLFDLSCRLRKVCRPSGSKLLLNDRADIAQAAQLDGVHLTAQSLAPDLVRRTFPSLSWIGASTHSLEEVRAAERAGCNFVLFGPVFETPAKLKYGPPQGLKRLREVAASVSIPVFAIGGINPVRAAQCMEHGAHGVAVISVVMGSEDPLQAIEAVRQEIGKL